MWENRVNILLFLGLFATGPIMCAQQVQSAPRIDVQRDAEMQNIIMFNQFTQNISQFLEGLVANDLQQSVVTSIIENTKLLSESARFSYFILEHRMNVANGLIRVSSLLNESAVKFDIAEFRPLARSLKNQAVQFITQAEVDACMNNYMQELNTFRVGSGRSEQEMALQERQFEDRVLAVKLLEAEIAKGLQSFATEAHSEEEIQEFCRWEQYRVAQIKQFKAYNAQFLQKKEKKLAFYHNWQRELAGKKAFLSVLKRGIVNHSEKALVNDGN